MGLVVACCCLLARRASSTLVSNNLIHRLKYYVLQLGDNHSLSSSNLGPILGMTKGAPPHYLVSVSRLERWHCHASSACFCYVPQECSSRDTGSLCALHLSPCSPAHTAMAEHSLTPPCFSARPTRAASTGLRGSGSME